MINCCCSLPQSGCLNSGTFTDDFSVVGDREWLLDGLVKGDVLQTVRRNTFPDSNRFAEFHHCVNTPDWPLTEHIEASLDFFGPEFPSESTESLSVGRATISFGTLLLGGMVITTGGQLADNTIVTNFPDSRNASIRVTRVAADDFLVSYKVDNVEIATANMTAQRIGFINGQQQLQQINVSGSISRRNISTDILVNTFDPLFGLDNLTIVRSW